MAFPPNMRGVYKDLNLPDEIPALAEMTEYSYILRINSDS